MDENNLNKDVLKIFIDSIKKQTDSLNNISKRFKEQLNGMMEISKVWTDQIEPFSKEYQKAIINSLKIFKSIDFKDFDEKVKKSCSIMLENGFYPYYILDMSVCNKINDKNVNKLMSEYVSNDFEYYRNRILETFSKYKTIIYEIFRLYKNKKYRLCVLSQINFLSIIFNEAFHNHDFSDKKMKEEIKQSKSYDENKMNYVLYYPYMYDENNLIKSYRNYKDVCERYKKYNYNRNSICHGYNNLFATRINCIRYFSVMMNATDLFNNCDLVISGGNKIETKI